MTSRFETPPMFSDCVIPGCRNLVSDDDDACGSCRTAFGPYLVSNPGPPPSADIPRTLRDVESGPAEQHDRPEPGGEEPIPQKLCWLCEQRRICTAQPGGWECDRCRTVT
jgi:hypothetical protein